MVRGLLNSIQDRIGIYGTGFNRASVIGVLLPIAFVILVGGIGALLVWVY